MPCLKQTGILEQDRHSRKARMKNIKLLPVPEDLYLQAKEKGVYEIRLEFAKSYDETFLDVYLYTHGSDNNLSYFNTVEDNDAIYQSFEKWAWRAYNYADTEGPEEHGVLVRYSIEAQKAFLESWQAERKVVDGPVNEETDLKIERNNSEVTTNNLKELKQKIQDVASYINVVSDDLKELMSHVETLN